MAREFWEVFLPNDIIVVGSRWDGRQGKASIAFMYPDNTRLFKATFVQMSFGMEKRWHLDEIVETNE